MKCSSRSSSVDELVTVEFEFSSWLPERFPLPAAEGQRVTQREFPTILEAIRREGAETFGPGFDRPDRDAAARLRRRW